MKLSEEESRNKALIGIVDAYGAVDYRIYDTLTEALSPPCHDEIWPMQTHKRWRFFVRDWQIDRSLASSGKLDAEDEDRILKIACNLFTPPRWEQQNIAWDMAGRPRGQEYDKWLNQWDKDNP